MCSALFSWFLKLDPDQIFAYSVPRTVSIRDRTLGILQYTLMLVIVGYIVGYTIVYEQRYRLIATDIFGSARLQLVAPISNFTLLPNQTQYCSGSNVTYSGSIPLVPLPCRYLNEYGMVYPEEEAGAILVATRISEVRCVQG